MTRETRIGLLVGLAFIVMFALILSELMSSKMPSATANEEGTTAKGLASQEKPPGDRPPGEREVIARDNQRVAVAGARGTAPPGNGMLSLSAADRGRPGDAGSASGEGRAAEQQGGSRAGWTTYRVRSGDTLIRIARRVYGPEHGDKYMLIYEANKQSLPNPATVRLDQELLIPPLVSPGAAARPRAGEKYVEMNLAELERHVSSGRSSAGRTHVVREGETLSDIAAKYLRDSSHAAVMKIFEANKEKLLSPDEIPAGVELRIPG